VDPSDSAVAHMNVLAQQLPRSCDKSQEKLVNRSWNMKPPKYEDTSLTCSVRNEHQGDMQCTLLNITFEKQQSIFFTLVKVGVDRVNYGEMSLYVSVTV
jgi:hypothetical protein